MRTTDCNRSLLVFSLVQLALAFLLVIPFSLAPAAWGTLLAFGVVTFLCAVWSNQKLPRVLAKALWIAAAILRWLLVAYVVYALFVFAPEATSGYDAESRAAIFAATLVPLAALCVVTLPAQAFVACRGKSDARRATLLSAFSAVVAVLLYGVEAFAVKAVRFIGDGLLWQIFGVVAAAVSFATMAVAVRGLVAAKGQEKTASDNTSKAEK